MIFIKLIIIILTLIIYVILRKNDHTMVAIGTDIYIFGGENNNGKLNDFYKIDTTNNTVTQITPNGLMVLLLQDIHSMVAIEQIYIFGGYDVTEDLMIFIKLIQLIFLH